MRVAVVAGPDPGHAFPAIALCLRLAEAGDEPVLLTGTEWLNSVREAGIEAVELAGLACLDNVAPPDVAVLPGVLSAGLYRETR